MTEERLPLSKIGRRKLKNRTYLYDFKGEEVFWDKLLGTHGDCQGRIKNGVLVFACYNCTHPNCYFKTNKERLKLEGYTYLE